MAVYKINTVSVRYILLIILQYPTTKFYIIVTQPKLKNGVRVVI